METDVEDHEKSGVLSLTTLLEYEVSSKVDFVFDYQMQFVNEASGKRLHNLKTGFDIDFDNDIDFDVSFFVDRVSDPLPTATTEINSTPDTPEENDYRLVFSVGYSF